MTRSERSPASAVRFSSTTKYHGDVRAVGPVNFSVDKGQSVALLGHNGSGKSTLLSIAAGILEPTGGSVSILGSPAGETRARSKVSYVRDHPVLYEDLSVREHLEYLSRLHGSEPGAHDSERLIERLGLSSRADDVPSSFSRGLRQKAALAVAFCRPFEVLLIDEPFAGLDPEGQATLLDLIDDVRNRLGAIIVATHDHSKLDEFDRAVILSEGHVIYDGMPSEIEETLV